MFLAFFGAVIAAVMAEAPPKAMRLFMESLGKKTQRPRQTAWQAARLNFVTPIGQLGRVVSRKASRLASRTASKRMHS